MRRRACSRRMECWKGGELLPLDGGRVTSREIRELERHVIDVAVSAAGKEDPDAAIGQPEREAGLAAAEAHSGQATGPGAAGGVRAAHQRLGVGVS